MLNRLIGNSFPRASCALIGTEYMSLQFLRNSLLRSNPFKLSSGVSTAKGTNKEP